MQNEILENECFIAGSPAYGVRPIRILPQEVFEIHRFHSIAVNNVSSNSQINDVVSLGDVIFRHLWV